MEQFDDLLRVAEKLLSPEGCAWDQKQTFLSLQPYVLEEAHEVIEAVDVDDDCKIVEELGDLLYTIVFYAKLAEKLGRFSIEHIVLAIKEKLIRRHPHVFGDTKVKDLDEITKNWEKIKVQEKGQLQHKSALDGIPPTLPTLIRTQKILKRILRSDSNLLSKVSPETSEKEIGDQLLDLILKAELNGIDAESALRRSLAEVEGNFRQAEVN